MQIDFSVSSDRVSHSGHFFKLQDVRVGGVVFYVKVVFLSVRLQMVVVDRSEDVKVVSNVPHGTMLGPLLCLLYTSDMSMLLEIALAGYADG